MVNQYTIKNILKLKQILQTIKNTIFHNDRMLKEGFNCIGLSAILNDSFFKTSKNFYLQMFLKKCKYIVKKIKQMC